MARSRQDKIPVPASITLMELRERTKMNQSDLAAKLDVRQGNISKIESRGDMRLSTLQRYLAAVGARLELRALVGQDIFVLDLEEVRGMKRLRQRAGVDQ